MTDRGGAAGGRGELPLWWSAVTSTLVGYCFSLCLSALIVLLLALGVRPVRSMERVGIDLGMEIFAAFQPILDAGASRHPRHAYLFVDVDEAACKPFTRPGQGCGESEPVPPPLVAAFLAAIRDAGAAVVVVDFKPPTDAADRKAFVAAAADGRGPFVIAPLVGDPTSSGGAIMPPEDPLIPFPYGKGRLRLAPMKTTTDAEAADGLVRHYPAFARIGATRMPTAPLLAAALAEGGATASGMDCAFYRAPAGDPCRPPPAVRLRSSTYSLARGALASDADPNRMFWTLPRIRLVDEEQRADFEPLYGYERLSEVIDPRSRRLTVDPAIFRGRLVVLGSSDPSVRDLHVTPLGVMSGSEILLNAARSFLDFGEIRETDQASAPSRVGEAMAALGAKARVAAVPALLLLPIWWLCHALFRRVRRRGALSRAGAALLCAALVTLGIGGGIVWELIENAGVVKAGAIAGRPVDLLLPSLALALEGFADAARFILVRLEWAVEAMLRLAQTFAAAVRLRVAALVGRG